MAISSVADLVTTLSDTRLLEPPQQDELAKLQQKHANPKALAKELLARGWLTSFQANLVINGKAKELVLGSYVILERLGEGGMGEVFKARHQKLGRIVALKVMRKKKLSNPDSVRRFQREIRAAAQLTHPNIILAFDSDQVGDAQYFTMEYIEGADLSKLLKHSGPLQVPQACDYIRQAAEGLQHAVERGLVHRDIKPSNLLVTKKGQGAAGRPWGLVKILDMGLARATESSEMDVTGTLTHAGVVVGTPDYISPEQARDSRSADIRSDIYSLGCTLYQLLAGKVPFAGGTGMEKLFKQQTDTAPPLRESRPEVPPDLQAVIGKMMAKSADERYQTPAEVAKALEPFCHGTAVARSQESTALAHDPSAPTPEVPPRKKRSQLPKSQQPVIRAAAKASERPPRSKFALAIAGGFGGALLVAGVLFAVFSGGGEAPATTQQVVQGPTNKSTQPQAIDTRVKTIDTRPKFIIPPPPPPPGQSPLDQLDRARIPPGERTAELPAEAVGVVGDSRLRHWGSVNSAAFSPDGRLLATGGSDRVIRLWDAASGRPITVFKGHTSIVNALAFTADGKAIVSIGWDQTVKVHVLQTGQEQPAKALPRGEGMPAGLSPDGRVLVFMGARQFKLWDMAAQREIATLESSGAAGQTAFSMDSKSLATWSRQTFGQAHEIKVWDTASGALRHTQTIGKDSIHAVALAADGQMLAFAAADQIQVVNALKGQKLASFPGGVGPGMGGAITQLAFGPDGKTLAASSMGKIRLLNLATSQENTLETRQNQVSRMLFSPDGKTLVTTSFDSAVRLWDAATGQERVAPSGHRGAAVFLAFTPDGRSLVSGGSYGDPGTRLWDIPSLQQRAQFSDTGFGAPVLTPEGQFIGRAASGFVLGDVATGREQTFNPGPDFQGAMTVFSANGKTAVSRTYNKDQSIKIWDLPSFQQRPINISAGDAGTVTSLSPDGQTLALVEKGSIRLYDTFTGKLLPVRFAAGKLTYFAFSPDGRFLAGSSAEGAVKVFDTSTGQERVSHQETVNQGYAAILFAPDSQSLAVWNQQRLTVLDLASGKPRLVLGDRQEPIRSLAFAAHGRTLAVCDQEGRLILHDLNTGAPAKTIQLPGPATGIAFAADGRHIATGNANGTIYILRLGKGALGAGLPALLDALRPDAEGKPIRPDPLKPAPGDGEPKPVKPAPRELEKPFKPAPDGPEPKPIEPAKPRKPEGVPEVKPPAPER